ncbi:hypothetical protein Val02_29570 [Virgisporangium aliadipatigenens]|uniref:NlpC/P60 domain-containing protein n=1 Tax=Virgisporangium aliadipatigenens TaxID=741659 RepID=A0A8J3YLH7_9ACTN|nr:hypothetical protein [Virgisporangium aliadipatigenens]GIJ46071.1 hypothetical protein Val02_29570 [Virgisporangium aliadipatigenens]
MANSTVNGPVSRAETLARCQHWVDSGVTYTQTGTWAPDPQGKAYRRDCSGLVSMAWHLGSSLNTWGFEDFSAKQYLPSLHDLRPGDALLKEGHIELFARWVDPDRHTKGAFVYSFNTTGETVQNPAKKTNKGHLGRNSWDDLNTYRPIRYKRIQDTGAAAPAGGGLLREPDGAISLVVGGAPFHLSPDEYAALGSPPFDSVPAGTFERMPSLIADGTLIRTDDGAIHIVAGGARFHLTPADYETLGRPPFVRVPGRLVAGLDTAPVDDTFLRDIVDGAIWQVTGGTRYHLDAGEFAALGSPPFTTVPRAFVDTVAAGVPVEPAFLREVGSGAIHQVVGGRPYHLDPAEYAGLGSPRFSNVPAGRIAGLPNVPADGTYLRDLTDGAVWVIVGGAKYHLSPQEFGTELEGPPFTNVPTGFLTGIDRTLPSTGFMRSPGDATVWQVVNGAGHPLSDAEWAQLDRPEPTTVPAGLIARLGTVPDDGSLLRDVTNGAVHQVVGRARRHLSADEYAELGEPPFVDVPPGFLAKITDTTPQGALFLRDGTGTVHRVVNGAKFALDAADLSALGGPPSIRVPAATLELFGTVPADGSLLRDVADGAVWQVLDGKKRHLSPEEFGALAEHGCADVTARLLDAVP